jgi:tRNA pseudouridine38-40 synthase
VRRLALGVEYCGTPFAGWSRQQGRITVEGCLSDALSAVAAAPVSVVCAGRTDAGVHATGQVAHFDVAAERALHAWVRGANRHLPAQIAVHWVQPVPDHFHARFSALQRHYRYWVRNAATRSALAGDRAALVHRPLDVAAMQAAARALIGEHDFSAFRSAECQSRTVRRRLDDLSVERAGEWVSIDARANAFLHHMVRNLVGTLLCVGRGEHPADWVGEVLASRDRRRAGATAPACGLYLAGVEYPAAFALPGVVPRGRPG